MKAMVGVVALVSAFGCSGDSLETSQTSQQIGLRCPDPDDCTLGNGGGVYTEECGNAHFGPNDFMILRFVNNAPGSVTIDGRGIDTSTGNYVTSHGGEVYAASYQGVRYSVYKIKETGTTPEFDLGDTGATVVSGDSIAYGNGNFQLFMKANGGDYTLTFWSPVHEVEQIGSNTFPLNSYYVRWNTGDSYDPNNWHRYCHLAPDGDYSGSGTNPCPYTGEGSADTVVFQGGMNVDPVKAHLVRSTSVTFSCRQGAIASARSWGYKYKGTDDDLTMFVAAMQMKRASYCGDEYFYTKPHTPILIKDDIGNLGDNVTASNMEASWGAGAGGIQARCINTSRYRHPELMNGFDPSCGGTTAYSSVSCPLSGSDWGSDGTGHLADRKAPPTF